ncbi:MAG TPA: uracil-DNA glycosylase family protein [Geminicoccaceae bacterium]|nr:uracil-DNA glycosylase family protein [Geminicoccaceae bacterium]
MTLEALLEEIRSCRICEGRLPLGPRPVLRAHPDARVLIVGQAPSTRVHATGVPWNDPSGERLRAWMGVDRASFYDARRFAIMPMGFCYPGRGRSGDLPPRPECAPRWHPRVLAALPRLALVLLVGSHAQRRYLGPEAGTSLTRTVCAWREVPRPFLPLPHPSGRNNGWFAQNPWFEAELVPVLRRRLRDALPDLDAAA